MDSELFEREWQRVAVDVAPPTYDQLQELLFHVTKCQVWAANGETRVSLSLEWGDWTYEDDPLNGPFIQRCDTLWMNRTDW